MPGKVFMEVNAITLPSTAKYVIIDRLVFRKIIYFALLINVRSISPWSLHLPCWAYDTAQLHLELFLELLLPRKSPFASTRTRLTDSCFRLKINQEWTRGTWNKTRTTECRYYELSLYCPRTYMEIFSPENGSKNSPRCNYAVVINQHRYRQRSSLTSIPSHRINRSMRGSSEPFFLMKTILENFLYPLVLFEN